MLLILLSLIACEKTPVATSQTDNPEVPVATLFTKDGCTVYRFLDDGRNHYFARCEGASVTTMSQQNCGKGCTRDDEITTAGVPPVTPLIEKSSQ